jgi:hypothetical protein
LSSGLKEKSWSKLLVDTLPQVLLAYDIILTHLLLEYFSDRSYVTMGNNWCQDAGIYEFTMGATGDKVKGRYSFVYVWEDGEWKISHHHSSVMPEAFLGAYPKPAVKGAGKEKELALQ